MMFRRMQSRGCLLTVGYGLPVVVVIGFLLADVWWTVNYELAANVAIAALAALVNVFTVLYWVRSKWWTNRIGQIFLRKCIFLSMVLDQIVLAVWWDTDYPGRQHIRFAIYALGVIAYIPMLVSLWAEQRRDRRDD